MFACTAECKPRAGTGVLICVYSVFNTGLATRNLFDPGHRCGIFNMFFEQFTPVQRLFKQGHIGLFKLTIALAKAFDGLAEVDGLCGTCFNISHKVIAI
jgi:hypothetical protein